MKKKSSITVPHKFRSRLAAVWPHQTVCIYFAHKRKLKRWLRVLQPSDPPFVRTSFIFHGVICVLVLPSALSSACECGPQSTVTRVCGDWEKHADMTAVASLHRGSERSKRKKSSGGREMLTGLPAREMNTKSKKKRKTRRQGVAVCVWRCGCLPALAAIKAKQEGKKCVLRPTGPRRTPTRHGSLSAPFVAAPPHACSRRGAQGRRHERVGGCASGAVGRETHGTPHRKSAAGNN
ncbi:hypothetical protein Tc00.1047053510281.10 [Trypanosoma cruzi]|uniref:Uncharacterized protein n=1 Tax=Trypanosoma cruzi (strain CL Brener) TaxID=353153 RepID=Q4CPY6_TRYCC|nr:hypothetical protein Tc00.1047053510281.10 [Trypanosoma cruzi]EAN82337.1 hypothetical protein Tc00.1047053510281.10 [Trypanosoma cruzi]|eukprot:XP_804188.1 hypothetical protein [Trypanosoma cruzi strain CL Brener]